jgi:4-hydroxy-tetrahydrodipicolinate reductase
MAVNLAIVGASGRMGREIISLAQSDSQFKIIAGVSRSKLEDLFPSVDSIPKLDPKGIEVLIDFSQPQICADVAQWCVGHKIPLVSGVTGLADSQKKVLEEASKTVPVLWAPNMSLGVAVMAQMFSAFKALKGYEFQIEEIHHKHKKDQPSGTALFLQERLKAVVGQAPEPLSIRGGGVFGVHKVFALGEEEVLSIEHTAMNRKVFARGALTAANWLRNKPAGLYKMADVLTT